MSLDITQALTEGIERTLCRNGRLFVAGFALLSVLTAVAADSALLAMAELAADVEGVDPALLPDGTAFGVGLPLSVIVLLGLTGFLATTAASIVAVRVFASDHTDSIPDELLSHRLAGATVNDIAAEIIASVLIVIGLLLVLPGIFLAICFYFTRPFVAIEDEGFIDALTESWRLSRGNRLALFALLLIGPAISVPSALVSVLFPAAPVIAGVVSLVLGAIGTVFGLAVVARAFVQLREFDSDEGDGEEPPARNEWNDPDGVEWESS